jgi:gliding motility-associated-like protein
VGHSFRRTTISPNGCVDDTTHIITILREYQHYNVFTPNGDGINDVFDPGIAGETDYSMKIYNRWGEKVFESNDSKVLWDGKDQKNGEPCAEGAYYYVWHFKLIGGIDRTIDGAVTLLRKGK